MKYCIALIVIFLGTSCDKNDKLIFPPQNDKIHVWVFIDPECPISQYYTSILNDYSNDFKKDTVYFNAVYPNFSDSDKMVEQFIKDYKFSLRKVADPELILTKKLNASITPEVFITRYKKILYQGMIDNAFVKLGEQRNTTDQFYLKSALESLLASENNYIKETKAVGCIIEK